MKILGTRDNLMARVRVFLQNDCDSHSHADFVPPDDKGHFAAPGVDEAGPAGVQDDVLPVPPAEPDGRVVEGLAPELQDYERRATDREDRTSSTLRGKKHLSLLRLYTSSIETHTGV